ncbi:MAG: heparin lyase I family protein [Bacteroidaceae bacterium]|nr:heparin lyase I family protein [Bacteroidaceae bacterium]
MRHIYIIGILSIICLCASCSTNRYSLKSSLRADESLVWKDHKEINKLMGHAGWNYTEHPNISLNDHPDGKHCEVIFDKELGEYIFRFSIHANAAHLDGDRGKKEDRQRNEMKSLTAERWRHLNGNIGEKQILKWKFRLPTGFRPSTKFCHIHQLKAQEGNNGAPLITISTRCNKDGSNRRIQVIHTGDTRESSRGVLVDNLPLSDFEGQWIEVTTEMHYKHDGAFKIKMKRMSDGKTLIDKKFKGIDLWRTGATNIRNKFGLYRSYGRKMRDGNDRPDNGIKDESIDLTNFRVYEKKM